MATSAKAEIIAQMRKNESENENKKGYSSSSHSPKQCTTNQSNFDQGEPEENPLDDQFLTDEEDDDLKDQFEDVNGEDDDEEETDENN